MESGIQFSSVIAGCMRLGEWGAKYDTNGYEKFIDGCLDLGVNNFDHADIYGGFSTEQEFGAVLKRRPDLKSKVKITTKCSIKFPCDNRPKYKSKFYDSTPEDIIKSVDNSLSYLNVDSIELLLLHRPDLLLDANAVADTFVELNKQGKVKYFGVSNYTTDQFDLLNSFYPLVNNQLEISLLHLDAFYDGSLNQCQKLDITPTAWSPLGGGTIFKPTQNEKIIRIKQTAKDLMVTYNCNLSQLLLAWLAQHPTGIRPLLGTSKVTRVEEAVKAVNIKMTRADWYLLLEASRGHEVA
jgi:predicted oxidoreductase